MSSDVSATVTPPAAMSRRLPFVHSINGGDHDPCDENNFRSDVFWLLTSGVESVDMPIYLLSHLTWWLAR